MSNPVTGWFQISKLKNKKSRLCSKHSGTSLAHKIPLANSYHLRSWRRVPWQGVPSIDSSRVWHHHKTNLNQQSSIKHNVRTYPPDLRGYGLNSRSFVHQQRGSMGRNTSRSCISNPSNLPYNKTSLAKTTSLWSWHDLIKHKQGSNQQRKTSKKIAPGFHTKTRWVIKS